MKPSKKTVVSASIWLLALAACVFFVGAITPMAGPRGHQWVMAITWPLMLIWSGGCFLILVIAYLVDRYFTRYR
jgi:hypothetical protein